MDDEDDEMIVNDQAVERLVIVTQVRLLCCIMYILILIFTYSFLIYFNIMICELIIVFLHSRITAMVKELKVL